MISILGCGWFGLALGKALVNSGRQVKGSITTTQRLNELADAALKPYLLLLSDGKLEAESDFFECDTLVISIPPKLRSGRADYLINLKTLIDTIEHSNIKQVVYISSTGVYPETNTIIDEHSVINPQSELSETLFEAEELFRHQGNFKTAIIRFGGLVGPGRHPGRFFAGKINVPNGKAPVNMIHLEDCVALTQTVITKGAFGHTFNACSPDHPSKSNFYANAALHAGLPLPQFIDELKDWKIVNSFNVPTILCYKYKFDNWQGSFEQQQF
jgi:nucleoside-diphosphate-sugar epimerase